MQIVNKKDFAAAVVLLLVMCGFYLESGNIDVMGGAGLGPLFFPYVMMGAITLLSALLLLKSISFKPRPTAAPVAATGRAGLTMDQAVFIALFFLYLLALPFVGYLPGTLAYLIVNMIYLGKRKSKWYAIYVATTICVTALIYYVFAKVMLLFLP